MTSASPSDANPRYPDRIESGAVGDAGTVVALRPDIRAMRAKDLNAILKAGAHVGVFTPEELSQLRDDLEEFFANQALGQCPDTVLVALVNSRPVGLVFTGPLGMTVGSWIIYWIYVDPDVQSRGIATALLHAAELAARQRGAERIFLETSDNEPFRKARSFYLRNGYHIEATVSDYYAPGLGKCIFMRRLNA